MQSAAFRWQVAKRLPVMPTGNEQIRNEVFPNMDKKTELKVLQMQQMFAASNTSLVTSTLIAVILAYMQRGVIAAPQLAAWLILIVLLMILRTTLVFNYLRSPVAAYQAAHARLVNYRLGVLASGAAWGSTSFLLFPANNPEHQLFLIFMLAGLTAGGVVSYAADLVSSVGFSVAVIVPIVIRLFVAGDRLSIAMAMAITVYFGFIIVSGRLVNRHLTENIVLRLDAYSREKDIRVSENRYHLLLSHSPVGIINYDNNLVISFCNESFAGLLKNSADHIIGMDMSKLKDQSVLPALKNALKGEKTFYEGRYSASASESSVWIAMTCAPLRDDNEKVIGGVAIVQDITERKVAEQNQIRLSRAHRLLSECGTLLIYAGNEQFLLDAICKLVVETGHYLMAWVGVAELDACKTVRPVAQFGYEKGYFESIKITWSDTEFGQGPVGISIRTASTVVNQDYLSDPKMIPWRDEAIKRGYQSSIAIPLIIKNNVCGVLGIHAADSYAFGEEEIRLLEELASNLSYGLETLRARIEHEAAQIALKVESEKNLALLRNASDGIHILDTAGNVVEASDSFCDMLGYRRDEIIGMNVSRWDANFADPELQRLFKAQFAVKSRSQFETRHRRKDGTIFDVEVSGFPLELQGRTVLFNSSRDISSRKQVEKALQESEKRLRTIIETEPECIKVVDSEGQLLEMNAAGLAMLEADSLEEAQQKNMLDYVDPEYQPAFISLHQRVMNGESGMLEFKVNGLKGASRYLETHATPMKDTDGQNTLLLAITRDVTERRQTERDLVESEIKYRQLFESSSDGIFLQDASGVFIDCNENAAKLYGLSREKIIGLSSKDISPERQADGRLSSEVAGEKFAAALQGETQQFEYWSLPANGILFDAELTLSRVEYKGAYGVQIVARDITERKKAETETRIAAAAFESQNGMLITDANGLILRVNRAFIAITGYSAEEVIGKNPRILSSGRHDAGFYADMWDSINNTGAWEGEIWNRRKSGEVYPEHLTITGVKDKNGNVMNFVATLNDISQSKAAEEEIRNLAFYDPLTQLPNRRLLFDRLAQALASSARGGKQGALLFIDLDNFKTLNDTLGHDVGDLLLQQVAQRLESCVREGDTVARLGGDEFVVMLEDLSMHSLDAAEHTEMIGDKILTCLSQPYQLIATKFHTTSSIGATLFVGHKQSVDELLKQADIAMYQAKKSGRNALRFFDPQMQEAISARAALEGELRVALEKNQFHLHYQIQVTSSNKPFGAEALIRWVHPERGMVSPAQFIPLAEETGLILSIGQWVLDVACAQLRAWQYSAQSRELVLAVNVSVRQFRQADFVAQVQNAVQRHAINPALLKLELTESLLLENVEDTITIMNALNMIGVQFSLDDFGTGYSSLQYLKRLPLNQLKIDQSFVRDIADDSSDKAIVHTIIAMAHSLCLDVIAEGVETEEQRQLLLSSGCIYYQGYLFGKPVPVEEFEALLTNRLIFKKDAFI